MKKLLSVLLVILLLPSCFLCSSISAKAAVVINGVTGEVIYNHNADKQLSMASTTKIMTALLLCENTMATDKITVPEKAVIVEGTSMGLKAGDTVTSDDLLYGMMLSSGNDAANTVALSLAKDYSAFSEMMNKRAKELSLKNTNFVTPSGLDSDNHYTTARDLAMLTKAAMQNKRFKAAVCTKKITLTYAGREHTLVNHNRLLRERSDIVGVKTGFTSKSGRCLVSAAKRGDMFLIAVTLNDPNDWKDHNELLDKAFSSLKKYSASAKKTVYVPSTAGKDVEIKIPDVSIYSSGDANFKAITVLPPVLYAPVKRGDVVGKLYIDCAGHTVKEISLVSENSVIEKIEKTEKILEIFKMILYQI